MGNSGAPCLLPRPPPRLRLSRACPPRTGAGSRAHPGARVPGCGSWGGVGEAPGGGESSRQGLGTRPRPGRVVGGRPRPGRDRGSGGFWSLHSLQETGSRPGKVWWSPAPPGGPRPARRPLPRRVWIPPPRLGPRCSTRRSASRLPRAPHSAAPSPASYLAPLSSACFAPPRPLLSPLCSVLFLLNSSHARFLFFSLSSGPTMSPPLSYATPGAHSLHPAALYRSGFMPLLPGLWVLPFIPCPLPFPVLI